MIRFIFTITFLVILTIVVASQEKPKAYLFDEFGEISKSETKGKVLKLRKELESKAWTKTPHQGAYLIFYSEKGRRKEKRDVFIRDILFDECRDCMGFSPNIVFINGGEKKEQKTQFWTIPFGAEPPEIDKPQNK